MNKKEIITGLEALKQDYLQCKCDTNSLVIDAAVSILKDQPDVVRCKDCAYKIYCAYQLHAQAIGMADDWFCADGIPKTTGEGKSLDELINRAKGKVLRGKIINALSDLKDEAYSRWVHVQWDKFYPHVEEVCDNAIDLLKEQEMIIKDLDECISMFSGDVAHVIRCKNCKHAERYYDAPNGEPLYVCHRSDIENQVIKTQNWFCAGGEKRDDMQS